jgi:transposase
MKKMFIGIDISKKTFDAVAIKAEGIVELMARRHEKFQNNAEGFKALLKWVRPLADGIEPGQWLFCGENTGDYGLRLANFIYAKGMDIWMETPYVLKHSSGLQRVKTDKADANKIAEYAMRHQDRFRPYEPLSDNVRQLRELFLYRHKLVQHRQAVTIRDIGKNDLVDMDKVNKFIKRQTKHVIKAFDKAIADCDKKMKELIESDNDLLNTFEIVTSMKGIGMQNAASLIVYTNNFKRFGFNARKLASYYGVAPFGKSSGTSVNTRPRVSGFANRLIKSMLTQAAQCAIRYCPEIRSYAMRLQERGKHIGIIINNSCNKMLAMLTAMVRDNQKYNPDQQQKSREMFIRNKCVLN